MEGRLIPHRVLASNPHGYGAVEASSEPASAPSGRPPAPSCSRPDAADFERADRIGEFWAYPLSRAFAELLIDCEEDRTLRVVLVGMLPEGN
jgi:hypothetical protein